MPALEPEEAVHDSTHSAMRASHADDGGVPEGFRYCGGVCVIILTGIGVGLGAAAESSPALGVCVEGEAGVPQPEITTIRNVKNNIFRIRTSTAKYLCILIVAVRGFWMPSRIVGMAKEKSSLKLPRTLEAKVKRWLWARQSAARAERLKEAIKPFIVEALEKAPERCREFGLHTLSLKPVKGRRWFNVEKAMAALGKELLEQFWEQDPDTERLTVD